MDAREKKTLFGMHCKMTVHRQPKKTHSAEFFHFPASLIFVKNSPIFEKKNKFVFRPGAFKNEWDTWS